MLTIFYKVFNEADFLKESLQSVYPYADRIVILEYCLESMRKVIRPDRVTDRGLSVDGTTEIIQSFPDPDKKIEYRPVGFIHGAESIPYQMIVDLSEVGEYIWVLDGDIVYPSGLCKNIRSWVDSGEYDVIWIPERVFFHDLEHEQLNFFAHHQRVFKNPHKQAFYFPGCFEVHWFRKIPKGPEKEPTWYKRDATFTWGEKEYHGKFCDDVTDGFAYHYALVRDPQRMLEKLLWQYEMIERRWENDSEREVCSQFRNPLDFKLNSHVWFLAHQPDLGLTVSRWAGRHPDVMYKNKWMSQPWDEQPVALTYEEALELVGYPGSC